VSSTAADPASSKVALLRELPRHLLELHRLTKVAIPVLGIELRGVEEIAGNR
jgi:hypothetical protein